jgi:AcrR family transcriptional regulator
MSPRRKLSELRRKQILEAAVRVISERGLCDTRISDVAERAGASSALVIYYFNTKDRLLAEALTYSEESFYAETAQELARIESAKERLIRLIELSCSAGPAKEGGWLEGWVLWLDLWARAPRDPDVARDRESLDRLWRTAIADIVRDGQQRGEFRSVEAEEFALRLAALIDGLAIQVVLGDPAVSAARMFEICVRSVAAELGFAWEPKGGPRASRQAGSAAGGGKRARAARSLAGS